VGHARVWKSQVALEVEDLVEFVLGNGDERLADLAGDDAGLAIRLEDLDQPLCMGDGVRPADDSMVGKQDGVVILDEGEDCLREGLRAGRFKPSQRGGADEDLVFGDESTRGWSAGKRKGCRIGRVAVDDGTCARRSAIDLEVEKEFAGAVGISRNDVAAHVGEADVSRGHVALADHGGGAEDVVRADAAADVAAVAIDVLAVPELAAGADDFVAESFSLKGVEDSRWGAFFRLRNTEGIDDCFEDFLDLVGDGVGDLRHGDLGRAATRPSP